MSRFHTYMTVGQALHTADQEQAHQMHHQYAQAQDALYSRDIEVQAVLDGALPAQAGAAPNEGPDEGTAKGPGAAAAAEPRSSPSPPPCHGSGGPAGRPPLERASVLSGTETRSVGSATETEEGVQVTQPQDDQPLRRFVVRASSFSKEDFDALLQHQGLYNVSLASDPRMTKTHLPPSKLDPPTRARPRRPRNLSVLRLPMARPDASWVMLWSTLVLLSDLTYSAFVVPISIGMWTSFYAPNWTTVCDFLFGAIFFTDIWMSLHIGFLATYNTRKLLVMNGRLVARHYLLSFSFFVDLCASTAWFAQIVMVALYRSIEAFDPHTALVVMEGVRLMRFMRVVRLLSSLVSSSVYASLMLEAPYLRWLRSQTVLGLAYLMYLIAVVVNFLGCLWNFAAGAQGWSGSWVNFYEPFVLSYGDPGAIELTQDQAMEVNRVWLWLVGNYWALTTVATVGFGDVTPSNAAEVAVAMAVEVMGVMFFGLLISSISELLQQANRNARRVNAFRAKMQSVERWMQSQGLPTRLRRRIKTFYAEVWLRQHEVKEETVLFQELPHALRNEVAWQACRGKLRALPLLRELPERTLYLLASRMTPFRFGPGHDLVTEGDPADRFWILIEGEVVALYRYREAERVEGPAVVGECVLLQEHEEALRTYPCTYRTLTACSCWMVRCRDFKPMLQPALQQLVKARALQSLARKMARYPEMWEGHAFRRLRAATPSSTMHRARSERDPLSGLFPEGDGGGGGEGAARSLARTSAPVGPARGMHSRAATWGGEQLPAWPRPASRGGSSASQVLAGEDADSVVEGGGAVGTPFSRCHAPAQRQFAQPEQAQPGQFPLGGTPAVAWRPPQQAPPGVSPLAEGQAVHLDAGQAAASVSGDCPGAAAPSVAAGGFGPPQPAPWQQQEPDWQLGREQQEEAQRELGQQRGHEVQPFSPVEQQQRQVRGRVDDPSDALHSVLIMAERSAGAATRGLAAGATALASAAAAAGRLLAGRSAGPPPAAPTDEDEECCAALARMAAAAAPPDRQAGSDAVAADMMSHLPTDHALAWLEHSAEHLQQAEQAAASAAVGAVAGGAAAQHEAVLRAVLAELQALRRDVDSVLPRPSSPHA